MTSAELQLKLARLDTRLLTQHLRLSLDDTALTIAEQKDGNADSVTFALTAALPCLLFSSGPKGETALFQFLQGRKCADGALLVLPGRAAVDGEPGRLWIVELKEKVGPSGHSDVSEQLRWALLRMRALCAVLDLPPPAATLCVAFREQLYPLPDGLAKIDRHGRRGAAAPATPMDIQRWHEGRLDLGGLGLFSLEKIHLLAAPSGYAAKRSVPPG